MTDSTADKSIIDPKYRAKYKEQDWLGALIAKHTTKTKEVEKTVGEGDKAKKVKEQVADGLDADALFSLAELNGVATESLQAQRGQHGFEGRARMTVRNSLQAKVKQRHGLYLPSNSKAGKSWLAADAEWLAAKGAPEAPTHDKTGEKFAVTKSAPKAEKAAA